MYLKFLRVCRRGKLGANLGENLRGTALFMNDSSNPPKSIHQWIEGQPSTTRAVDLSIVVPAYNEERRLPSTLVDMIDYLDSGNRSYEIIVVDDGSVDGTSDVVHKFERIRPQVRLIRVPKNYGKGHAVRTGVLNAHGRVVLFADADGATPIRELERLESQLVTGTEVVIGSRALSSSDTRVTTRWYRKYLGRIFNFVVNILILPNIADTQCGFKLFSARAAKYLFERQSSDGFSFDVEVLYIARRAGLAIAEVPINWNNVPGSKVNLILDSARMLGDIVLYKVRHRSVSSADFSSFLQNFERVAS